MRTEIWYCIQTKFAAFSVGNSPHDDDFVACTGVVGAAAGAAAAPRPAACARRPSGRSRACLAVAKTDSARIPPFSRCNASQKMIGKGRKRKIERLSDESERQGFNRPVFSTQLVALSDKLPLSLLAAVKTYLDTLVSLKFFNSQGVAMFSFVRPPPRVPRPFAGARVYRKSLTHAERLGLVGCGLRGKLVRMLSLGEGCTSTHSTTTTSTMSTAISGTSTSTTISVTATTHHSRHDELRRNWGAFHKLMQCTLRYVAARQAAAVRDKVAKQAEELCASGQFAAAVVPLKLAIEFGDMPSRALNAWLLIDGREGVAYDESSAFVLVYEGARVGCHHCQGVLARCYLRGSGFVKDEARSLELARESARNRSRYGQDMLGHFYLDGSKGLAVDYDQAFEFHQLAAQQNLDDAQNSLGYMYWRGLGVVQDRAEALRWFQLAAAQGHPFALSWVAFCHETGESVRKNKAEAIRWYRRAQAAGHPDAADELRRLRARPLS